MFQVQQRLQVFQELIRCCHDLYLWQYDAQLNLTDTDCPKRELINGLFSLSGAQEKLREHIQSHSEPSLMTNSLGLMWAASPWREEDQLRGVFILGPFFLYDVSTAQIENELRRRRLSETTIKETCNFLRELPVISSSRVIEYTLMLHCCITGKRLRMDDIRLHAQDGMSAISEEEAKNIHGTYEAEQEMLRLVREGDLNYKAHTTKIATTGRIGDIGGGNTLRKVKNLILVNITLISRAAIEGGLPPETSYTISDRYYQAVERSTSFSEIAEINNAMKEDYIQRVHLCRQNQQYSKPIRACMNQLQFRLEESFSLDEIAASVGYTPYYLGKKFKKETGQSIKDYLQQLRLERSKTMLQNTDMSIQDISTRLQFCSPSYYAESFRKAYGISPTEYRSNNK